MSMAYSPILPLVNFGSIAFTKIQQTMSELEGLETTVSPQQMVISQNCANTKQYCPNCYALSEYSSTAYKPLRFLKFKENTQQKKGQKKYFFFIYSNN